MLPLQKPDENANTKPSNTCSAVYWKSWKGSPNVLYRMHFTCRHIGDSHSLPPLKKTSKKRKKGRKTDSVQVYLQYSVSTAKDPAVHALHSENICLSNSETKGCEPGLLTGMQSALCKPSMIQSHMVCGLPQFPLPLSVSPFPWKIAFQHLTLTFARGWIQIFSMFWCLCLNNLEGGR